MQALAWAFFGTQTLGRSVMGWWRMHVAEALATKNDCFDKLQIHELWDEHHGHKVRWQWLFLAKSFGVHQSGPSGAIGRRFVVIAKTTRGWWLQELTTIERDKACIAFQSSLSRPRERTSVPRSCSGVLSRPWPWLCFGCGRGIAKGLLTVHTKNIHFAIIPKSDAIQTLCVLADVDSGLQTFHFKEKRQ